jgi:glucosamine--fructose-6-phosphate aminotransferase (isomerizing)
MCGIFGIISETEINKFDLKILSDHAKQRGVDASGLYFYENSIYKLYRSNGSITNLLNKNLISNSNFLMGHSRLVTNGMSDNQPIYRDSTCVIHNGIIVNHEAIWPYLKKSRNQEVDTEIIAAITAEQIENNAPIESIPEMIMTSCKGTISSAVAIPKQGKLCLFSNNGSLYFGKKGKDSYFSSERYPLDLIGCDNTIQLINESIIVDIPACSNDPQIFESNQVERTLIPYLGSLSNEKQLLKFEIPNLKRCTKCVLPSTMPFISFDTKGVCNYCKSYKLRNKPKPISNLNNLINKYRRNEGSDCLIPFSGGRDSCYGLHLVINELNLKPITYTYDWGMITDLGRRNISRMCSILGVENIIIAADIRNKRENIRKNLSAWLKSPHLGMISILTAGDKHFFQHIETVKKQTGISLNIWGINPLEVTHFKAGFLGIPPYFEEDKVYTNGALKQLRYQALRFKAMLESPGYFNSSIFDTLTGEYYRSFHKKEDYYHIFDYWRWDEGEINDVLLSKYDWEIAPDTNTTWRIGDGTAAFYNYIYYSVAGFTEHDTFRSNQIREGDITRDEAISLVNDENRPRYENIKWYLDSLGMDFKDVVSIVNSIPKLYSQ